MVVGLKILFSIIFLILFGFIGYKIAEWWFRSDDKENHLSELEVLVKETKRLKKQKANADANKVHECRKKAQADFTENPKIKDDPEIARIHARLEQIEKDNTEDIYEIQAALHKMMDDYKTRQGYKWFWLLIICCLSGFLIYFAIIPGIELVYITNQPYTVLKDDLSKFINPDAKVSDMMFDEVMLVSWDLRNRKPYLITKTQAATEFSNYNNVLTATTMSAASPLYFNPVVDDKKTFISGDANAVSPALFAYYYATNYLKKLPQDITVVSVGGMRKRANKISADIGLTEWASRIITLTGESKLHSQDYLLDTILRKNNKQLHKFELYMSYDDVAEIDAMDDRK